jgi:hypothetical protein
MSGLLDNKTRMMDVFLTPIGRGQALQGGLKFRFATFSDSESRYQGDEDKVAIKSTSPIGIESSTSPWDQVVLTTNESDFLLSFLGNGLSLSPSGEVITGSSFIPRSSEDRSADYLFDASLSSLQNLQILSTEKAVFFDPGLSCQPLSYQFSITDNSPFDGIPSESSIDGVDSLFQDFRLSNVPNFQFLPPVQRGNSSNTTIPLGDFVNPNEIVVDQSKPVDLDSLEGIKFSFSSRTENNTLVLQIVEESNDDRIVKLDVIKWGSIGVSNTGTQRNLYFVGKVFVDGFETPTFVNIFTMVLE